MDTKFYANYMSSVTSETGCVHGFVTQPVSIDAADKETNRWAGYPAQVNYHCPLCNKQHGFRLGKVYEVGTPSQQKRFDVYVLEQGWEQDVDLV